MNTLRKQCLTVSHEFLRATLNLSVDSVIRNISYNECNDTYKVTVLTPSNPFDNSDLERRGCLVPECETIPIKGFAR